MHSQKINKLMKYIGSIAILAVCLILYIWGTHDIKQISVPQEEYQYYFLDNGMTYTMIERNGIPIVTLIATYEVDLTMQTEDNEGVFHFLEHLILEKYHNEITALGGVANGVTSQDYLILYLSFPKAKWNKGLELFNKMTNKQQLEKVDFSDILENEKKVVLSESDFKSTDAQKRLWNQIETKLYNYRGYQVDVLGSEESLNQITNKDIHEVVNKSFNSNQMLISIVGDLRNIDVYHELQNTYGDLVASQKLEEKANQIKKIQQDEWIVLDDALKNKYTTMFITWNGPGVETETQDTVIADVVCESINNAEAFKNDILKDGYVKSYQAYYQPKRINGQIIIYAIVDKEYIEQAKANLTISVTNLNNYKKISSYMLRVSKRILQNNWYLYKEDGKELGIVRAKIWATKDLDYANEYINNVDQVSEDEIISFANTYIIDQGYIGGNIGDSSQ